MTDYTALQPPSRVLLVATPHGRDWSVLRDHLTGLGWRVDVFNPTPRGDDRHPEPALPLLDGVELAVLLVTDTGPVELPLNRRTLLLAGELKGALGDRKVMAFLETEAAPVLAEAGIAEFRYERNNIDVLLPQIVSQLGQGPTLVAQPIRGPGATTPWPERFGVADGRVSAETLVALGVLAIVAAIVGVVGYRLFDSSPGRLSAEVFGAEGSATTDGAVTADGSSPGSTTPQPAGPEARPSTPLGPPDAGSVLGLPARCVVETPRGLAFEEVIDCDEGIGGVIVRGFPGPWHNEIRQVSVELGVLGEAIMESGDGSPAQPVELESGGTSDLESRGSDHGVQRLVLVFTANGQEVELAQRASRGGNIATLTYRLDLDQAVRPADG